jgi:hypothetical protein
MSLLENTPRLFPTALTNFLECPHLVVLERLAAGNLAKRPFFNDPMLEVLRERGLNHERAYLHHLDQTGKRVIEINRSSPNAFEDTLAAMHGAVDVIVQARLENGSWAGWSDILLRVDGESRFGRWRYEPVETKLTRETRGATLIQLCLYGELLAEIQGAAPELLRVVVPDTTSSRSAIGSKSSMRTFGWCSGTSSGHGGYVRHGCLCQGGSCQYADAIKDLPGVEAAFTCELLPVPSIEVIAPSLTGDLLREVFGDVPPDLAAHEVVHRRNWRSVPATHAMPPLRDEQGTRDRFASRQSGRRRR